MYYSYLRYIRHIILPNVGIIGQDAIKNSKVLCIGIGGLGSAALLYLSAVGIGCIGIVDFDIVSYSNLNRQIIYTQTDIGKKKTTCAAKFIKKFNNKTKLIIHDLKLKIDNCFNLFKNYDIILDCTDNLETKFLISDFSTKLKLPLVHGSVFGTEGYIINFLNNDTCYRCLYNNSKELSLYSYGILGPVAGIIGSIQALICILIILNKKNLFFFDDFNSKLFIFNFLKLNIISYKIEKLFNCTTCS